jgi:hypothetical protein
VLEEDKALELLDEDDDDDVDDTNRFKFPTGATFVDILSIVVLRPLVIGGGD